jgi:hypothetical protein
MAYVVHWAGKTVLASGPVPIKPNHDAAVALVTDLAKPPEGARRNVSDYLASLGRLRALRPDRWLPEVPVDAQNANVYDSEWEDNIGENLLIIQSNLSLIMKKTDR